MLVLGVGRCVPGMAENKGYFFKLLASLIAYYKTVQKLQNDTNQSLVQFYLYKMLPTNSYIINKILILLF